MGDSVSRTVEQFHFMSGGTTKNINNQVIQSDGFTREDRDLIMRAIISNGFTTKDRSLLHSLVLNQRPSLSPETIDMILKRLEVDNTEVCLRISGSFAMATEICVLFVVAPATTVLVVAYLLICLVVVFVIVSYCCSCG